MTTQEIYRQVIILMRRQITLIANVNNGCAADTDNCNLGFTRCVNAVAWCRDNDKIIDLRTFFCDTPMRRSHTFAVAELTELLKIYDN